MNQGTYQPVGIEIGLGVKTAATTRVFTQGVAISTGRQLDIEIEGEDLEKWKHVKDDSQKYSVDEIQAEVERLEPDSSKINMAVVMYCLAAIRFFRNKTKREIEMIWYELAMRWSQWIQYWEDSKYHIDSIPWKEFSWYEFLSYMYVAWKILKPEADLWLDYSREYELAKQLDSKK